MICAVSPSSDQFEETLNTLKYANRAKQMAPPQVPQRQESKYNPVQEQVEVLTEIKESLVQLTRSFSTTGQRPAGGTAAAAGAAAPAAGSGRTGPHGGAFLNMIHCPPGTPIVEIGYKRKSPMAYPSYYHTMSRRLGLPFWLVLGEGGYDSPITAPVEELAALVEALLTRGRHAS